MARFLLGAAAVMAVISFNSAAPTDPAQFSMQMPQIPSNIMQIDETDRAQARSVLDDMLSQYPTLVDAVAGLLKTQQALTSNPLQALASNPLQSLSLPGLQQPTLDLAELSRGLPGLQGLSVPGLSGLGGLGGLPGLSGDGQVPALASSTLSTLIDGFLGNLRAIAASPMQLAPIRLVPPGGTPVVSPNAVSSSRIDTRGLFPELPELPKLMVPFIVTLPNDEGLPAQEVVDNFKQKVKDQMPPGSNGDLQAHVTLDPLLNVIDAKPVLAAPAAAAAAAPRPAGSKEPLRYSVNGGLLGGNTDVQIFLRRALEQQADNVRNALQEAQRGLTPVTSLATDFLA